MAAVNVIEDSQCNNDGSDCALEANDGHVKGQVVHRFVNNFHIHQGGDSVKCGNCGTEKSCPRCNATVGKQLCGICGMWISANPDHIANHQRVHSGERPFQCDVCNQSFKQRNHLAQHKRIHAREYPYECETCGEFFRQQSQLDAHQRSIHSDERGFECTQCSKAFKLRASLMRHYRLVHKVTYDCADCGLKLGTRNAFTDHSAQHAKDNAESTSKNVDYNDGSFEENGDTEDNNTKETTEDAV